MKKFNFNLKALLNFRKQQEEEAQREMMLARQQLQKILGILEHLEHECTLLEEDLRNKQGGKQNIEEYRSHYFYLQDLRQKIQSHQDRVMEAQNLVEKKRQAVNQAMQNKKIIENIHEKQYSEWKSEYEKLESKLSDELSTIRHIRNKEL